MDKARDVFALIGFFIMLLGFAGSLGIGHFHLIYGPDKYECAKVKP
jgi:hypothetical protein